MAVDNVGNVVTTVTTLSPDVEGANNNFHGGEDVFVAKVSPEGVLLWATEVWLVHVSRNTLTPSFRSKREGW